MYLRIIINKVLDHIENWSENPVPEPALGSLLKTCLSAFVSF